MHDIIKDPIKASLFYREESLRAIARRDKEAAFYWRLILDVVQQVIIQSYDYSIITPTRSSFVYQVTQLALSTYEARASLERTLDQTDHNWSFQRNIPKKIFTHYCYWVFFLIKSASTTFDLEINQLHKAMEKYQKVPSVAHLLHQALICFQRAQGYQQCRVGNDYLIETIILFHWLSSAYMAIQRAHIDIEEKKIKHENNTAFLQYWEKMSAYHGKALSLRIKSAEAISTHKEYQAAQYALASSAMSHASESSLEILRCIISGTQEMDSAWQKRLQLLEEIAKKRIALAALAKKNLFLERSAVWLEVACEADFKSQQAMVKRYKRVASCWKLSSHCLEYVASLYAAISDKRREGVWALDYWHKTMLHFFEKKAQKSIPLMFLEKIFFCMPKHFFPSRQWRDQWERGGYIEFVEKRNSSMTANTWLYQTGSLLQKAGVHCEFFTKMPSLPQRGIVITLSGLLYGYSKKLRLDRSLFVVDIVADAGITHPAARLHLIPNSSSTKYLPFTEFIPHWSQPFLVPRNRERGDSFETICFMGDPQSIAPELCSQEWHERLDRELGLRFIHRNFTRWHDFSDVDCVVAIRDFSGSRFCYKPGNKLYNAWHAGIPFIGGKDSAFSGDGHPGYDYLVASSLEELFLQLKKLKEDPLFRARLVKNGAASSISFTREAILESWKQLVEETIPLYAWKWYLASALKREILTFLNLLSCTFQSLVDKYYKPKNYQFVAGTKTDPFSWTSTMK